jgi:hypothetical protein
VRGTKNKRTHKKQKKISGEGVRGRMKEKIGQEERE